MPARKKHPSARARRNKTPGAATLTRKLAVVPDEVDYSGHKVTELRDLIDDRNDGRPEDERLAKRGTKAQLIARLQADDVDLADDTPKLPDRPEGWTAQTESWWADVWSSPMSDEWDDSDQHNLLLCALLHDDMWTAETPKARKEAAGEFRLQRASLGLDPYSRRRLEWQIEVTGEAQEKGEQRRQRKQPAASEQQGKGKKPDPRAAFSVV